MQYTDYQIIIHYQQKERWSRKVLTDATGSAAPSRAGD